MRTELYIAYYPKGVIVVEIIIMPAIIAEVVEVNMDWSFLIISIN
jgi:hypothetical protein